MYITGFLFICDYIVTHEINAAQKIKDLQARSLEDKPKDVHREPNKTIQIKDYA